MTVPLSTALAVLATLAVLSTALVVALVSSGTAAAKRLAKEREGELSLAKRELAELTDVVDQVAEGLLALTEDARVLRINSAARELLGLAEVVPFSPIRWIIRDPVLRGLAEASVVEPEIAAEVQFEDRTLQVETTRSDGGGSVVLLRDVSAIRRLEAVRTDFVANASHELKTPLTVIRGAAETVMDEDLPAELRGQFLGSILGNAVRLQRLVEDLLDLSRFESGEWKPQRGPVDLGALAGDVWSAMESPASEKGIHFMIRGHGTGIGDESATYQVFQNLFDNAIRYVPVEGGKVVVEIVSGSSGVEVGVSDNGAGIPAAELGRVFERFYRVDAARSREEGGTGLGLAIVRHLVTTMGGEVWAESTVGSGTTVRFSLPTESVAEANAAGLEEAP